MRATASEYAFDVVSIKRHKSEDEPHVMGAGWNGNTFGTVATTMQWLIQGAYGVEARQISGAPNWLDSDSERYDITAKMDSSAADELRKLGRDQRNLAQQHMIQTLLADRCKLAVHTKTKELPVYALVISKNGPKLHESKADGPPLRGATEVNLGKIHLRANMRVLARLLSDSRDVGRVVVDKTGLNGRYDVALEWKPEGVESLKGTDNSASSGSGPSIFTALEEQLGLTLEPQKGPVEIVVIEHVERPSEN